MKSFGKFFALLIIVSFVGTSCGKYEDGPKISLASKTARIINTWVVDEMYYNGVEQTLTADDKDDYVEYQKDDKVVFTEVVGSLTTTTNATWKLDDDKEKILVTYSYTVGGLTYTTTVESTILRLKSNEMWLETTDGSNTEEYHFVSK